MRLQLNLERPLSFFTETNRRRADCARIEAAAEAVWRPDVSIDTRNRIQLLGVAAAMNGSGHALPIR